MAISAYVGLPGHGKSYGVVENVICKALEIQRIVFTNIPMKTDEVFEKYGINVIQFEIEDIVKNPNWWQDVFVKGSLFVIDEVPKLWPAGMKANQMREGDRQFLAEHRHMVGEDGFSTEVVLVVQKLNMIASFCRSLIENTFWVVKHTRLGMNNNYRVDVYAGAMDGSNPQLSKREREIQGKFKPEIFALYHSHTQSVNGSAGNEQRADNRFNVFKGASIKIGIFLIIVCSIVLYFGFKNVSEGFGQTAEQQIIEPDNIETQPVKIREERAKPSFLSSVDSLTLSHSLRSRINGITQTKYFFKLIKGDTEALVSDKDLVMMGYAFKVISECLLIITGNLFNEFVMCERVEIEKGFFESSLPTV